MRIAQQQLGHSDPRITLAIYSHVIGDSHRQAVENLPQLWIFVGHRWTQLGQTRELRVNLFNEITGRGGGDRTGIPSLLSLVR